MSYSFEEAFPRRGPLLEQVKAVLTPVVEAFGGTLAYLGGDDDTVRIIVGLEEHRVRERDEDLDMEETYAPDGLFVEIQAEPTGDPAAGRIWVYSNYEHNRACWETACAFAMDLAARMGAEPDAQA